MGALRQLGATAGAGSKRRQNMRRMSRAVRDPDLAKVGDALKRAAASALALGRQTKTPVYVLQDGKIVNLLAGRAKASTQWKPGKRH